MRAPTVLAALALTGTFLLGGASQALADSNDDTSNAAVDFGSNSPATSDFGQGASGMDQGAPAMDQGAPAFDQDASGLGQGGSVFDLAGSR
ncbi:hypothetical protein ABZ078_01445 [Streptomyces sp. NPDC006385]|uniref:hypothetical protein n=1 Tax=Streptomyces sp. NPDC006385 TaxID=3156761 RepID=UPI0033B29F8D